MPQLKFEKGCISPDKKYHLTNINNFLGLYEASSGRLLKIFVARLTSIYEYGFTPNSKIVYSSWGGPSQDCIASFDVFSSKEIFLDYFESYFFSADNRYLSVKEDNGNRIIYDLETGRKTQYSDSIKFIRNKDNEPEISKITINKTIPGFKDSIKKVLFNPGNNKKIMSLHDDGSIKTWDIENLSLVKSFMNSSLKELQISNNGKFIITDNEYSIIIRDAERGNSIAYIAKRNSNTCVSIHPNSNFLAIADDKIISIYSLTGNKPILKYRYDCSKFNMNHDISISFSPDGTNLLINSFGEVAILVNLQTKKFTSFKKDGLSADLCDYSGYSRSSKFIFFYSDSYPASQLTMLSVVSNPCFVKQNNTLSNTESFSSSDINTGGIYSLDISPCDKFLVTGGVDIYLHVYKIDSSGNTKSAFDLAGHYSEINSVCYSNDGKHIISGSSDRTIRIWDVKEKKEIASLISDQNNNWLIWTPDGYYHGNDFAIKNLCHFVEIVETGKNKSFNTYPAEKFRHIYNKPEIIKGRLK